MVAGVGEKVSSPRVVPRCSIEHRGIVLEEMDIDATLKRRLQICVVDELAHSNVPESRHEKTYQEGWIGQRRKELR